MDVMLGHCNVEVRIESESIDQAIDLLHTLLLGLYMEGISPTLAPFSTTHSVNEYSGINSQDSESLRSQLPEGLQSGLRSDSATLEAWPVQLSFSCHALSDKLASRQRFFEPRLMLPDDGVFWRANHLRCVWCEMQRNPSLSCHCWTSRYFISGVR